MLQVLCQVHRCYPATTEFALDCVPVGEGGFETVEKVWHCVLAPLAVLLEYGLGLQVARQGEDELRRRDA